MIILPNNPAPSPAQTLFTCSTPGVFVFVSFFDGTFALESDSSHPIITRQSASNQQVFELFMDTGDELTYQGSPGNLYGYRIGDEL